MLGDGTARCWGNNWFGQLGDGTTTERHTPVAVSGLSNAVAIAAGNYHTCAVLGDGTARCWGRNDYGQLGDGTTTERHTPVAVSGLTNAVAVSAGGDHTCAVLSDGTARCWGDNSDGQLGDGTTADRLHTGGRLRPEQRRRHLRRRWPHLRPAQRRHRPLLGRQRRRAVG